jgi:hypothetical protein
MTFKKKGQIMPKPDGYFTTGEVAKIFGIKYGRIKNYVDAGELVADHEEQFSEGAKHQADGFKRRYFNRNSLYQFALFLKLLRFGFQRKVAAQWAARMIKVLNHPFLARSELEVVGYIGQIDGEVNAAGACSINSLHEQAAKYDETLVFKAKKILAWVDSQVEAAE